MLKKKRKSLSLEIRDGEIFLGDILPQLPNPTLLEVADFLDPQPPKRRRKK